MERPQRLQDQLEGLEGSTRQKGARLVLDLAMTAGAEKIIPVQHAHISGVSVLTGGHGLRRFLADLESQKGQGVCIPTTLNSAGCDAEKFEDMHIAVPGFLEAQFEIIHAYQSLGIQTTLSCTPYDRGIELESGIGSWAESNAVCYANTWSSLMTNRESGLSALATALTGFAPEWGLHLSKHRQPNVLVHLECDLHHLSDWSIFGDWIGKQVRPDWHLPFGPMPYLIGAPAHMSFAMKKALTAAAANYGTPMLWVHEHSTDGILELDEHGQPTLNDGQWQGILRFTEEDLRQRYDELAPKRPVDLVVIGCPQASLEEIRITAASVRTFAEMSQRVQDDRLWVFTSRENYDLALADGSIDILEQAGVLILKDTCPEVTPYNREKFNHLLTNSMKAEHYLTSGLNRLPTSVATIHDCVKEAFQPSQYDDNEKGESIQTPPPILQTTKVHQSNSYSSDGQGLLSQNDFSIVGKALVTDVPITFLGYVNPDTGIIEEEGHPLYGESIKDSILIFPKGSGSTVAPYVLMGLLYTSKGPKAVINRDVCPLTLPACSLLGVPYGFGFEQDACLGINTGDTVRFERTGQRVTLSVIQRIEESN
ncbi:MAG: aconitase X [archaeon]|nr:aconitase X [archaeon]MDA1167793.1 aconitase X [archaeon]